MKKIKIKKEKQPKKRKFSFKNAFLILVTSCGIMVASVVLAFALYIVITSPDFVPDELYNKEATVLLANDGKTEIARIGNGANKENTELVTYSDLPEVLIDALVATEDSRFFQHNGFDAARFFKASLGQLAGQNAGGASTLSMQVMKNKFNGTESEGIAGIIRKFKDIYMAVFKLEAVYTKEEIIEFYLNSQWLGNGTSYYNSSIVGVEQASQYYFGKSVSDLTLPEASLIVGMFNNPFVLNPYRNPEGASERRSTVLSLMVRHGYISEEEKEFAESVSVSSLLVDHSKDTSNKYQAFIDYVLWQVEQETGDDPQFVPMTIYTTLDPKVQDVLEDLEDGKLYKFVNDSVQFGMAITSTKDGSITALSGGRNYLPQSTNRAVSSKYKGKTGITLGIKRQIGSTAKVIFDYGPHIEYLNSSPSTIFLDREWHFSNGTSLVNSNRDYRGPISMRDALVASRNIPAVQAFQQVAEEVGIDKIADFVHSLGIDYGPTLFESAAIGGIECGDPLTMSAAYAAFGRGGYYIEPYSFTKVVYAENSYTHNHKVKKTRVMSEQTAYLVTSMLVSGGKSNVGGNFTISGTEIGAKGGTTTLDNSQAEAWGLKGKGVTPDHWNITFSPDYAIALWYGYDTLGKNQPFLQSNPGIAARKAIMKAVATKIYKTDSKFTKPSGIKSVTIEKETYPTQLASEYTPSNLKATDYFKSGYEPAEVSPRFDTLKNPTNGKYSYDGSYITISWTPIETPEGIDQSYIEEMFNDKYWQFYEDYRQQYYDARINYNTNNMGEIGYQVYLKDENGDLISLGYTYDNTFTYLPYSYYDNYTFVVKSCYSIFKSNMSKGLTINTSTSYDTNISDMLE